MDLQQGARPRADLRARARRAADAEGQAGRRCDAALAAARALIAAREAARWRWCRAGARTRSSRRSSAALRRALRRFVKADHAARSPASALEDDLLIRADKNPNTAGGARAVRRRRRAAFAAGHRPGAGLGRGLRLRRGCRAARRSSSSTRTCSRRTATPTCSSRSASRPSARGHYTNFEGVGERLRAPASRSRAAVADAEALFAALARRQRDAAHDPGPRRLRSSSSATRSAC